MTLAALVLASVLCALGTRLAGVAFIAAAVLAATDKGAAGTTGATITAIVGTWTAALAATLILLDVVPTRKLALPAVGATAVIAATAAPNAAVVCGLWVAASIAGVLHGLSDERWRRFAVGIASFDLLLVAGIATTATSGFQGWPQTLAAPGAALLLASAALRTPLVATPARDRATASGGMLVVRAQVAFLVAAAVTYGGPVVGGAAVVLGAAAFAFAPFTLRRDATDAVQELGLFAVVAAGAAMGWIAPGWAWGALAAGTLTHQLRFMVAGGTAGQWPDAILRGGGSGLPFLPVVAAVLHGASAVRGWRGAVLVGACVLGLAARTRVPPIPRSRRRTSLVDVVRVGVVMTLAVVAGLWGGALTMPREVAATEIGWPPAWAAALVAVGGVAGSLLPRVITARRSPQREHGLAAVTDSAASAVIGRVAAIEIPSGRPVVWVALGVLVLAAAGVWAAGLARGFL